MKIDKGLLKFGIILLILFLAFYSKYYPQELSLTHGYPTTTDSSDAIFHALETEWIAEDEIHARMAPYLATGREDVYDAPPPQLYIGSAFFTKFAGIESYDSIYLLAIITFAGAAIGVFLLLSRHFGTLPALTASLMVVFPLSTEFFYMLNIGWFHQFASLVFFPMVAYFVLVAIEKNRFSDYLLIALAVSASTLAHTIEGSMLLAFTLLVFLSETIRTKKLQLKNYSVMLIPILVNIQQYIASSVHAQEVGGLISFSNIPASIDYGIPIITYLTLHPFTVITASLGIAGLLYLSAKSQRKWEMRYLLMFFFVYFLGFYANWGGPGFWALRIRYTSYLLVYPLAGIGLYFASQFLEKKHRPVLFAAALVAILIFAFPIRGMYQPRGHVIDQPRYDALLWIMENTPEDATVFFFDGYWQGTAAYSRRLGTDLRPEDMEKLAAPELIEDWNYSTFGYHVKLPYKTGPFSFGNYDGIGGINLCEMDYKIFINYQELMPVLQRYEDRLLETNTVVYSENGIVILHDRDGKAGCLA